MNRLNKIILSFVLPFFCFLISVSFAMTKDELDSMGIPELPTYGYSNPGYVLLTRFINGNDYRYDCYIYDKNVVESIYLKGKSSSNPTLYSSDVKLYFTSDTNSTSVDGKNAYLVGYTLYDFNNRQWNMLTNIYGGSYGSIEGYAGYDGSIENDGTYISTKYGGIVEILDSPIDILSINSSTGESKIFYQASSQEEPDTPSLPSNTEIAQAVQSFYNSDYYKNNKYFEDFFVLYNTTTGYFSFVGHNQGIDLGQVIVPADYTYDGITYSKPWWKFFLRNIISQVNANLFNKYYWLYGTADFGENFEYQGKGAINDLLDVHFATASVIVYSTSDYPVVKIEINEETGALEPVEGTIPGDQYTYDENVDPTTNEYNPLENFVPINPSQSILGDVDFDEINKTFEENKDILNIEGASWLFTANNKLVGYFIGFLSLLIVFLIISRILGG